MIIRYRPKYGAHVEIELKCIQHVNPHNYVEGYFSDVCVEGWG